MTQLSTNGARVHWASALGMTRCYSLTEVADIFRALGVDVVGVLTLEVSYHDRSGGFWIRDNNGLLLALDSTTTSNPPWSITCPVPTPGVPCWSVLPLPC